MADPNTQNVLSQSKESRMESALFNINQSSASTTMPIFSLKEGQHWEQICQLLLAVGLSAVIGIERQLRHKSAGLRTNTLVGMGSALFMLISKFGFGDVLSQYVSVDPSRIAANIVSGIGFVGGGIIFKQQSEVRGLTTAAAVWVTAAVGSACGAGLPILASLATALYFVIVLVLPSVKYLIRKVRTKGQEIFKTEVIVRYRSSGSGLEPILQDLMKNGVDGVSVKGLEEVVLSSLHSPVAGGGGLERQATRQSAPGVSPLPPPMDAQSHSRVFDVHLVISGQKPQNEIVRVLSQVPCVVGVTIDDDSGDEV